LIVDPSCRLLVEGFQGQYHFPEGKDHQDYDNFEAARRRAREPSHA
jgi:hypothetical protein